MEKQTEKKQLKKFYNLSEVEAFLEAYEKFWQETGQHMQPVQTQDSGSNPGGTPPPPPGSYP